MSSQDGLHWSLVIGRLSLFIVRPQAERLGLVINASESRHQRVRFGESWGSQGGDLLA